MENSDLSVVRTDGSTTVSLPMPLPYVPVPEWISSLDLFSFVAIPVWGICSWLVRSICRIQLPPLALFRITPNRFRMELVARESGNLTIFECDPKRIVELRKNRFEPGLWIHVRGQKMHSYLQDVDGDTIHSLCRELWTILASNGATVPSGLSCETK